MGGQCGQDGLNVTSHAQEGLKNEHVFVQASKMESNNAKGASWRREYAIHKNVHVCRRIHFYIFLFILFFCVRRQRDYRNYTLINISNDKLLLCAPPMKLLLCAPPMNEDQQDLS